MKTIFVDTSFFLQLRQASELRWSEITDEAEVLLLVPRAVQEEIDRLKQDGNNRRSRRARKSASLLREMVQAPEQTITLRESDPRVLMRFPPPLDPNRPRPATLDLSSADDRIVEAALAYSFEHPSTSVCLLTNDTGPMLTARDHGLSFIQVPDGWMLAPEPDERDKSLQELIRRVDVLERAHPIVEIVSSDSAGKMISDLELKLPIFAALAEDSLAELIREVRERCPPEIVNVSPGWKMSMRVATTLGLGRSYHPPTEEEIRNYSEIQYPNWLETVKNRLCELPEQLNRQNRRVELVFSLSNTGTVPALNAIVEFHAYGGVMLIRPKDEGDRPNNQVSSILGPPKVPTGTFTSSYGSLDFDHAALLQKQQPYPATFLDMVQPERKDRNAFYWRTWSAKPAEYLALECDEFRHQQDPEPFRIVIILPADLVRTGQIECKFSASNLPTPNSLRLPLRIEYCSEDPQPEARRLIAGLPQTRVRGNNSIEEITFEL